MSLETQLASKATTVFNSEYQGIFNRFYSDIQALTGISITNTYSRTKEDRENLVELFSVDACKYQGNKAREYLLIKHKELYIAEFIRKAEELQEYISTQEQGN